jgi:hypothetical protein
MPSKKELVSSTITWLVTQQADDGSFAARVQKESSPSPFFTALILDALCDLPPTSEIMGMRDKAANYLLGQKTPQWSFNYVDRRTPSPYPDDLDDTCCALASLYRHDPKLLDGAAWAQIVPLLTHQESAPGGPYRTWIVPLAAPNQWQDIDPIVNTNIAYFLSLQDIQLPALQDYLSGLTDALFHSPYYPCAEVGRYFLARSGSHPLLSELQPPKGPLAVVLNSLTLTALDKKPEDYAQIKVLLTTQKWGSEPFCFDSTKNGEPQYAYSPALVATYALAAFVKDTSKKDTLEDTTLARVKCEVLSDCRSLIEPLRSQAEEALEKLITGDASEQILGLPFLFQAAMGTIQDNELVSALAKANLYGWLGYTLADNFLDDEGHARDIPLTTWSLRRLHMLFSNLPTLGSTFFPIVSATLDALDAANSWEVAHCRAISSNTTLTLPSLPTYPSDTTWLAERSLGHILGPLALMLAAGHPTESDESRLVTQFFKHAITARQLNDDAHDWESDLRNGHLTYVVTDLLLAAGISHTCTLDTHLPSLRTLFWEERIVHICEEILKQCTMARTCVSQMTFFKNSKLLEKVVLRYEKSAQKALDERQKTLDFLQNYTGTAAHVGQ